MAISVYLVVGLFGLVFLAMSLPGLTPKIK
jgi:hypothetical protein